MNAPPSARGTVVTCAAFATPHLPNQAQRDRNRARKAHDTLFFFAHQIAIHSGFYDLMQ
jgi:hypothetical protein